MKNWLLCAAFSISSLAVADSRAAAPRQGTVVEEPLTSQILRENRIGLSLVRKTKVYLPPGYRSSQERLPVVYFLHNAWWSPSQALEDGQLQRLMERGFAEGDVREFILVLADFSGPTTGSLYENSPVSGRWLDYLAEEVVPLIDGKYRTLPRRDSRAVVGDFFGGRGALKLAMSKAEIFSVAYALHPVATGNGDIPWNGLDIDWSRLSSAQSYSELAGTGRAQIFWAIHQAFSPNVDRPPCYCNFFTTTADGRTTYNADTVNAMKKSFLLDETLSESAVNLRSMRGLALDWGRFDVTQAHVTANRQFSRLLEDLGVDHAAEEYRGDPWNRTWTDDGRFAKRVLPFLEKTLLWSEPKDPVRR